MSNEWLKISLNALIQGEEQLSKADFLELLDVENTYGGENIIVEVSEHEEDWTFKSICFFNKSTSDFGGEYPDGDLLDAYYSHAFKIAEWMNQRRSQLLELRSYSDLDVIINFGSDSKLVLLPSEFLAACGQAQIGFGLFMNEPND